MEHKVCKNCGKKVYVFDNVHDGYDKYTLYHTEKCSECGCELRDVKTYAMRPDVRALLDKIAEVEKTYCRDKLALEASILGIIRSM